MSPDADLNGNMETSKSTSGLWVELVSADGLRTWPLAWRSKRQCSTASSTQEAETISMATGLKSEGLPMQDLFTCSPPRSAARCASGASRTTRPRSPWVARIIRLLSTSTPYGAHLGGRPLRDPGRERRLHPAVPGIGRAQGRHVHQAPGSGDMRGRNQAREHQEVEDAGMNTFFKTALPSPGGLCCSCTCSSSSSPRSHPQGGWS